MLASLAKTDASSSKSKFDDVALMERVRELEIDLQAARKNKDRAAVLARAERGFEITGASGGAAFKGSSEVVAQVTERIRVLEHSLEEAREDLAAVQFVLAHTRLLELQAAASQLDAESERVFAALYAVDPASHVDERNQRLQASRFHGHETHDKVMAEINEETRADDAARQELQKQMNQLSARGASLSMEMAGIKAQFPDLAELQMHKGPE